MIIDIEDLQKLVKSSPIETSILEINEKLKEHFGHLEEYENKLVTYEFLKEMWGTINKI